MALGRWVLRLRSALGLVVGAVNEDVAAYFRASTILGAVVTLLLLGGVALAAFPMALNLADAYLPLRTTTTTVTHLLPPNTFEPAGRPYGFWTAEGVSYDLSVDPKIAPGAPVTIYWRAISHSFAGMRAGGTYFAGPAVSERQSEASLTLTAMVGLVLLLCLAWTTGNLENWRAVERDLRAQPVTRRGRVLEMPLNWLATYSSTLMEAIGTPLAMVDSQTGQPFTLGIPVRAIDTIDRVQAQLAQSQEEVIATFYPHTKVMTRFQRPGPDGSPVEVAA